MSKEVNSASNCLIAALIFAVISAILVYAGTGSKALGVACLMAFLALVALALMHSWGISDDRRQIVEALERMKQ